MSKFATAKMTNQTKENGGKDFIHAKKCFSRAPLQSDMLMVARNRK